MPATSIPTWAPTATTPTTQPTSSPSHTCYEVQPSPNERCAGSPAGGWGGLGKVSTKEQCAGLCKSSPGCTHAVYNTGVGLWLSGRCTAFSSCSFTTDAQGYTWAVCSMAAPTPTPSLPPVPSHPCYEVQPSPNKRCFGSPVGSWGGLGTVSTKYECAALCKSSSGCTHAVYNVGSGRCTSFASCSLFQFEAPWKTWVVCSMAAPTHTPSLPPTEAPSTMPSTDPPSTT
eukprot:gene44186-biopygen67304